MGGIRQHIVPPTPWWLIVGLSLLWSWTIYLVGYFVRPEGSSFTWVTQDHALDVQFYLSLAAQQADGRWFFYDLFTTEPHRPVFFSLHHWLVGFVSSHTGMSLTASYHLIRSLGIVAFHWTAWQLSKQFLKPEQAPLFLFLLSFTAGLIGFWHAMPELYTPMAFLGVSPFVWGLTLTMGSVIGVVRSPTTIGWSVVSAFLFLLLVLTDPSPFPALLFCLLIWTILEGWISGNWRFNKLAAVLPGVIALLSLGLYWMSDPAGRAVASPPLPPPPIWQVAVAHGWLIVAGVPCVSSAWREDPRWRLVILWIVSTAIVVYLNPFLRPRRLFEGVHIPLCLLATRGWYEKILPNSALISRHPLLVRIFLILGICSGLIHYSLWQIEQFRSNRALTEKGEGMPLYLSQCEIEALNWLRSYKEPGAVLCSYQLGPYVPPWTKRKVFVGHWSGTVNLMEKLRAVRLILTGEMPFPTASHLFRNHHIRFALITDYERRLAAGPIQLDRYGRKIFEFGDCSVYRLKW
ncbi:MAG: hypothetical protein NZ959_00410 [Armatimonadetes bacterium]|nr:hypothetical protein [Armatimonadota bacterium]MDW8120776.1 hypothetical protein [Armatimonadota bacterium]